MFIGGGIIGGRLPEAVFTDGHVFTSNGTPSYSQSLSLGVEHPSRLIVAWWNCGFLAGVTAPSGCTINGVAATKIVADPIIETTQMWAASVPTGTSGTFFITRTGGFSYGAVFLYAIYYLRSTTPVDADFAQTGPPSSLSLTTSGNGVVVGGGWSTDAVPVWTGLTVDDTILGSGTAPVIRFMGASVNRTGGGSLAISLSSTGSPNVLAAASFR